MQTQRSNAVTQEREDAFAEAVTREQSLLDAMVEVGVRTPAAPSALDAIASEPVARYSRGRKIVVRNFEALKQDADVLSVGGLFGAVDEATEPVCGLHGKQIPFGMVETDRGSGCCVCGDKRCNIGPFVRR